MEGYKQVKGETALLVSDSIEVVGDRYYVKATARLILGDGVVEVSAYAREPISKKGMDDSQVTGAASSYARKYALGGLFAIDDTKDADHSTSSRQPESQATPKPQSSHQPVQAADTAVISDGQLKRLMAIANEHKVTTEQQQAIVTGQFGFTSRKQITKDKYDAIVTAYETINANIPFGE